MSGNLLRTCAGCGAYLLTSDGSSQMVFCAKCYPKHVKPFDEWAASLKAGDRVFVQPYLAWRGLSHSEHVIIERDGDDVTVQIIGLPESRRVVGIAQLGQHDLTPARLKYGAP